LCVTDFEATSTTQCACGTARCCGGRSRWSWAPRRRRCWRVTATPTPDPDQVRHYFTATHLRESIFHATPPPVLFRSRGTKLRRRRIHFSALESSVRNLNRFGPRKREQTLFSCLLKTKYVIVDKFFYMFRILWVKYLFKEPIFLHHSVFFACFQLLRPL
jgi:hypothetical protein